MMLYFYSVANDAKSIVECAKEKPSDKSCYTFDESVFGSDESNSLSDFVVVIKPVGVDNLEIMKSTDDVGAVVWSILQEEDGIEMWLFSSRGKFLAEVEGASYWYADTYPKMTINPDIIHDAGTELDSLMRRILNYVLLVYNGGTMPA